MWPITVNTAKESDAQRTDAFTEKALTRRLYHLNTLHELNQEISALKNVRSVLRASLLYIIGVYGLKRGFIVYKKDDAQHHELACRGMHQGTAMEAVQRLENMPQRSISAFMETTRTVQDDMESPLVKWLKKYEFHLWLPFETEMPTWGGIGLGEKLSEETFTAEDLELLSTIAINIQSVLHNVSLIEALHQSVVKENRIRTVFQRYAPDTVVDEVLNPSNEALLLGESQEVRDMFDQMITRMKDQADLEFDLNEAHRVQEHLLPVKTPEIQGFEIVANSIPARHVCGDFYDFIPLSSYEVGLSLADISGKGMSAAMIATMVQSAIRMCVGNYYPISAILAILNRFMCRHTEMARYATMFYGQINAQERILTYSNAGHPPPILCRNGHVRLLEVGGSLVGMFEHCSYDQETIQLQSNDILVIYSDGVTDAGITPETAGMEDEDGFGQDRLEEVIVKNAALSSQQILETISDEVTRYAGRHKQFDDITLIVMKVT